MKTIKIKDWGKDHWSLLAYIEYRCVNHKGILDKSHLRISNPAVSVSPVSWKPEYGTRLKGFFLEGENRDLTRQLPNHDDLDCIEDFEETGIVKNTGTGFNPACLLTKKGKALASKLSSHKQDGGNFNGFADVWDK